MSVNRVILIGRMTRDAELRTTTTGKSVANFSIAVDRMGRADERQTDFFTIVAWGQTAEYVCNYQGKGRLIAVDGRLQSRKYQTQEGANREVVEVVADRIQGLERVRDDQGGGGGGGNYGGGGGNSGGGGGNVPDEDEYDPFADE